jgi:hypothetical protein
VDRFACLPFSAACQAKSLQDLVKLSSQTKQEFGSKPKSKNH